MTDQRAYPPAYVDAKELAYLMSCSESTIYTYRKQGLLPEPFRIGDLVRWRWQDVDAHLQGRAPSGADDKFMARLK